MARRHGVQTLRREDGRIICEKVKVADTWLRRMRGLLFRRTLPSDEGCVLRPGFSIHTAFMQFPIDVVFLDHDLVVQKISARVRPFHATSSRGAREVVELRSGECERRGLAVGDRVSWASYLDRAGGSSESALDEIPTAGRQGAIVVASQDARFAKLMAFLLAARGIDSVRTMAPAELVPALASLGSAAVVILDAGTSTADALATLSAVQGREPETSILLAAEADQVSRAPAGIRLYDKWNETDTIVEQALAAAEHASAA